MLKKILLFATMALLLSGRTATADPINLLTNGSFESGLSGWTVTGGQAGPVIVQTNTDCCFGETVPTDNATSNSPDAAGNQAVYFFDDVADQTLSQSIFLTAGTYEIGFDAYVPLNGFDNFYDATFTGTIAGVTLANFSVHQQNDPQQWLNFSGLASVSADGTYDASFVFQSFGVPAADVLIDRVYIVASNQSGGTPIPSPEPSAFVLLAIGLTSFGIMRRRIHGAN